MPAAMPALHVSILLAVAVTSFLLQLSSVQGQQDFTTAQVPDPFRVGDFYPPRPEVDVCRPIRDHIDRNSVRFTNELVTNTNPDITFSTADSRIMSSRMQSRLNSLATLYWQETSRRMTILRAWTQFPNSQINNRLSLHYEGRSVQIRLSSGSNYNQFLQLAVQEAFDWVAYNQSNLITLSVIPTNCDRNVDCVFVLDQSGSVGPSNHGIAIQFIQNIVAFFNIGLNQTRVGFVAYSSRAYREFDLNDYTTLSSLTTRIGNVNYRGGGTRTGRALTETSTLLDPANTYGARPDSDGIPKIVVLITDGQSHDNVLSPSNSLKDVGVIVYAVGIGSVNVNELTTISSDPDNEHVFLLRSYRDAAGFVDFLSVTACETPAIINPDGNVTTTIPPGGFEYFQTQCSAYTDTVLIELTDLNGTNFLYVSATEDNPGPLTENTLRNETIGIGRRTLTLTLPSSSNTVYIGVQGQTQQNAFNIIVWDQLFRVSDVSVDILEGGSGQQLIYDVGQNLLQRAPTTSLRFSIIEGNTNGLFFIDTRGRVNVSNVAQLNPNQQEFHNLTVLAQHVNINCQRARTRISIRVFSNRITFGTVNTVTISENEVVGRQVARIIATGGRGPIQFSIISGNNNNMFRIGSSTGIITLANTLNYETTQTYTLTVQAQTTEEWTVTGTVNQRVDVMDVNEEPSFVTPCARAGSCTFDVTERQSANILVGSVEAQDPDLPSESNGKLSYRLSPMSTPFSVNTAGSIRTVQPLDREMRDSYTLTLSVSDSSVTIQTTVIVRVNDIDDNSPVFIQAPSIIQVQENMARGIEVAQYIAQDNDIGTNAAIVYAFTPANSQVPFSIHPQTGVLSINGDIDYETTEAYTIIVTARNPNNISSNVSRTTIINVVNLNDNTPQFSQNPYTQNLPEDTSRGTTVVNVSATDADSGSFGSVTYSIVGGNFQNSFAIDSQSGVITNQVVIDREIVSLFSLRIEARDVGNRRRTARVEISITDVNDNTPVFVNAPYQVQVREDVAVPFGVLQVTATDADEPGNPNSQVTYNITSGNFGNTFTIDSSTGQISATTALDFEMIPRYTLNLCAFDGGNPSRSAETTAMITVLNVNENPPSISGDQSVNISESASVGSIVASYTALDPDNNVVTFSITSGNAEDTFSVNSSNGRITLANPLNYEMTTMYSIVVRASDGQRSTTANLNVTVLDENEFSPVFMGGSDFSVNEEELNGTLVGTIMATDADGDPRNNRITYSFVQQTSQFTINRNSGEISTVGRLNRENLTQIFVPPLSQVSLDVTAQDSASPSRQTTKSIMITLVDINDNNPAFAARQYKNSLFENLPAGQTVFQVSANDQDLGLNREVQYSFILNQNTNDTNLFQINKTTGILSTTGPLDCEKQTNYTFTITATDRGTPSLNSSVQGVLSILDENDNSPVFSMNPYTIDVPENSQEGSIILTVSATDRDKGSNGKVKYSVMNEGGNFISIEGDEFTTFAINSTTGTLSHETGFNYERAAQVNVSVIAEDLGVPRRTSNATIIINVINIDESPPTFTSCPRSTFVVEELSLNSVLTHCIAEDPDNVTTSNSQAVVTYQISSGNDNGPFTINRMTGAILNTGRLDREMRHFYALTIVATDLAGQSTSTDINIGIRDINDNAPKFSQNSYSYDFRDVRIQSYEQEIMRVSSSDRDSSENGTIRYFISQITRSDLQTVITITASDMGIPQLSTNATLTVNFERSCLLQDYEVDEVSGRVNAYVLCRIAILQMSLNVSLGSSDSIFSCSILHNSRMSYQWVHNGSLITLPTFFPEQSSRLVNYTITDARFEHAGEYACKATTQAGSLQSTSSSVKIRVSPTITVPPKNALIKEGETATFRCVGSGIPPPTVKWYDGLGNLIAEGTLLMRENVQSTNRNQQFICIVNSDAGRAQALATLTVYSQQDIIKLEIDSVSNPTPTNDGSCHFINKTQIEDIFRTATKRVTMVTGFQGDNICEETPCLPNPCKNSGVCSISDTQGGYVCTCRNGYTGENCNEDQDECADDPCFDDSTCVNTEGGFQCLCPDTTTGHLCQYSTDCLNPDTCTNGTVCVSTLSQGYICHAPPPESTSVVITGELTQRDVGALTDRVQTEVEKQLAAHAAATSRRRKRQTSGGTVTTLATACEPRFVQPNLQLQQFVLIWLCPTNTTEPTPEDQVILCDVLLESPLVVTCTPPGGQEMAQPTTAPLGTSSVTINIVLVDNTGKPIDSLVSSKEIEESGAVEQLKQATGLQVASLSALDSEPRPGDSQGGAGVPVGMVMGIVIGAVVIIALVIAVVVAVIIFVRRKQDVEERKQLERRMAIQMLEKETIGGSGGSESKKNVDAECFTTSVENLISGQSTEESTYDSLQPDTKAEENHYDSLPPRKTEVL